MKLIPQLMLWAFIGALFVGAAANIYATRFFLPRWWSGFHARPEHAGYGRKILLGYGIFVAAIVVAFAAGGIAELTGGWN